MSYATRPASAGGWLGFVSGSRALLVAQRDEAFIGSVWSVITGQNAFQGLLDLLTSRGLAATPAFVLVDWEPDVHTRVIVRGDIAVTVTDAAGPRQLSGAGVSTWVEQTLPDVRALEVTVPGAASASSELLPLRDGVVLLASLRLTSEAEPANTPIVARPARAHKAAPTEVAAAEVSIDVEATMVVAPEPEKPVPMPEVADKLEGGYDYLFGETLYRSVSDAAVPEPEGDSTPEPADEPLPGDHDGETVLTSDIAGLRTPRRARARSTAKPAPATSFVLVVSPSGAREPLTQPVLVGRNPSVSNVSGGALPRLLTLGSIDHDISRNHAQFALEGDTVVVTDLHSKNGTVVVLPGREPQKLRAGEPTAVIVGTVVDLGSGLTLTVEEDR